MTGKVAKIKELLKKAEDELARYDSSRRFSNLSQACEKTWVAFNLLLEEKSGKEIRSGKGAEGVAYDLGFGLLYEKTWNLHVVHYEGSPAINEDDFIVKIRNTIDDVRYELKRIRK